MDQMRPGSSLRPSITRNIQRKESTMDEGSNANLNKQQLPS